MRRLLLGLVVAAAMRAGVLSQNWYQSRLTLQLDDGRAEIELISPVSFRAVRVWGGRDLPASGIQHDLVLAAREDDAQVVRLRTKYLIVEIDKATLDVSLRTPDAPVGRLALGRAVPAAWKVGEPFATFTRGASTDTTDFVVCYGPTPKEIFEQYRTSRPDKEPVEKSVGSPIRDWAGLAELVRTLNRESLATTLNAVPDPTLAREAPADVRARFDELAGLEKLPELSSYMATYLREAVDRGFPPIHPLAFQFPKDPGMAERDDVFMLGDELLIAPVIGPGIRRRVELPRGKWTDLRTNIEYAGRQAVEIDAPVGRVPLLARNGALLPLVRSDRTELHYMPNLGGEFFLWEPVLQEISMFHAGPALDLVRVEAETRVTRNYEWVIHHTAAPTRVEEGSTGLRRVNDAANATPGSWWHDAVRNDVHVLVHVAADTDSIVNLMF